jgi:hypothetical protein
MGYGLPGRHAPTAPASRLTAALAVITLLLTSFIITACSSATDADEKSFEGTWVGFFALGGNRSGQMTLTITSGRSCAAEATISGNLSAWGGDFELRLEGNPIVRADETLLGEVTITRYCPGRDTCEATGQVSGLFSLEFGTITGEWSVFAGELFSAGGTWAGARQ